MGLQKEQSKFAVDLAKLILHIDSKGFDVSVGDVFAVDLNPIITFLKEIQHQIV